MMLTRGRLALPPWSGEGRVRMANEKRLEMRKALKGLASRAVGVVLALGLGSAAAACDDTPQRFEPMRRRVVQVEAFPWTDGAEFFVLVNAAQKEEVEQKRSDAPAPTVDHHFFEVGSLGDSQLSLPDVDGWGFVDVSMVEGSGRPSQPWPATYLALPHLGTAVDISRPLERICVNPAAGLIARRSRALYASGVVRDPEAAIERATNELLDTLGLSDEAIPPRALTESCLSDGNTKAASWMTGLALVLSHAFERSSQADDPVLGSLPHQDERFANTGKFSERGLIALAIYTQEVDAQDWYETLASYLQERGASFNTPEFVEAVETIHARLQAQLPKETIGGEDENDDIGGDLP